MEAGLGEGVLTDLFVLRALPLEEAASLVRAVRAHKAQGEARILVVDEGLDAGGAAALAKAGCDDCYTRPFLASVYAARVRGLLRRGGWKPSPPSAGLKALGGRLVVDPAARRVTAGTRAVGLSRVQFDLLELLARAEGHAVAPRELLAAAARHLSSLSGDDLDIELEGLRGRLGPLGDALRRDDAGSWTLG